MPKYSSQASTPRTRPLPVAVHLVIGVILLDGLIHDAFNLGLHFICDL